MILEDLKKMTNETIRHHFMTLTDLYLIIILDFFMTTQCITQL